MSSSKPVMKKVDQVGEVKVKDNLQSVTYPLVVPVSIFPRFLNLQVLHT